jgi:hypothetical protein
LEIAGLQVPRQFAVVEKHKILAARFFREQTTGPAADCGYLFLD